MGKREQPQPERNKQRAQKKRTGRRIWLAVVLPVVLATAILALGTLLPDWLLSHRELEYTDTTAQAAIADVHPYGDQYENVKQSLLRTIKVMDGYGDGLYDGAVLKNVSGNELYNEYVMPDHEDATKCLMNMTTFLSRWASVISESGNFWMSGLTELVATEATILPSTDDPQALLVYAMDYSSMEQNSGLFLDMTTGTPVSMELYLMGWGGIDLGVIWQSLLTVYQEQLGLQFTEVSLTEDDETTDEIGIASDDLYAYGSYSAVSADQTLRMNMKIQEIFDYSGADKSGVYAIEMNLLQES